MIAANAFARIDEESAAMARVVAILLEAAAERRARLGLEPDPLAAGNASPAGVEVPAGGAEEEQPLRAATPSKGK